MAIDEVRINGFLCSWDTTEFRFDGESFHTFSSIDYGDKRTRTLVYSANRGHAPIGRTRGKYEPSVLKLTGKKKAVQKLREFFAARSPSGTSYGDAIIPIVTLQFFENDDVMIVKFLNVTWDSDTSTHAESADALEDTVELQPERIIRNGITLYGAEDDGY